MSTTTQELETKALSIPDQAKAIDITTNEQFEKAGEFLKTIKGLRAEINETFDPIIAQAHATHREAIERKRKVDAPLVEAEGIIKPRIAAYLQEQERIRREEELRLQKLAQEEEERQRLEHAISLEAIGETEMADQVLNEKPEVVPVILPKATKRIPGIVATTNWDFDIVDPLKIPRQYLVPDMVKIRGVVRALKTQANIPGIRVREITGISARRT